MAIKQKSSQYEVSLEQMLEAGCHFGHQSRRWNPKMAEYIFADQGGVHVFDLLKTRKLLITAMEFVKDWVSQGNEMVFVGTKRQAQQIVEEEAQKVGAPFVRNRWLGGTITNWDQIVSRIKKLNEMRKKMEAGDYDRYTKKERVLLNREISRLERMFGGISDLKQKPEALFVVDTDREKVAVKEAMLAKIPVVGMVDSNADPDGINYVIPINDDAIRSIKLVVEKIAQAYADGVAMRKSKPSAQFEEKSENKVSKKPESVVKGKPSLLPNAKDQTKETVEEKTQGVEKKGKVEAKAKAKVKKKVVKKGE